MRSKLIVAVAVLLVFANLGSAAKYQIIDLGEQSSFFGTLYGPLCINETGEVAGTEPMALIPANIFLWQNGGKSYLFFPEADENWVNGQSNASHIVGGVSKGFLVKPFVWHGGVTTYLNLLPLKNYGEAKATNNNGDVVGFVASWMSPWLSTAVLWKDGQVKTIAKLQAGDNYNLPNDINNQGKVVGVSGNIHVYREGAFLWQDGQPIVALGSLAGDTNTAAYAINDNDCIIGISSTSDGPCHAVMWREGAAISLAADLEESWANGINNSDQVVGGYSTEEGSLAFLWDSGQVNDLTSQVVNEPGWILTDAYDINSAGWIVGVGVNPGGQVNHGYVLIPLQEQEAIEATVDIKPETLDLKSNGKWITVLIKLPAEYKITDIDTGSIRLEDTLESQMTAVDLDEQTLVTKFLREALTSSLPEGEATLTITGQLLDETEFVGSDSIRVISPGPDKIKTKK
jgi:probable HAF family extracellular repeat protein